MVATESPLTKLLTGMADAWAPRERIGLADWCAREIHLPAETGPSPGLVNLEDYPFVRGILDAADDPEVETLVVCMASQVSKTTVVQCILAGLAILRPAPAMLCAPDQDATKKLRDKFYRLCDGSPALRDRVPPHHLRNMSEIDFGRSICHLAWTGNPQRVSGESCRVVLLSECDRSHRATHEGAVHELIGERTKAWHNFLIVLEGTPTDEKSVIISEYEKTDQRQFLVPCPHCDHYQLLRFFPHKEGEYAGCGGVAGIKDEAGNWIEPDAVDASVYYLCEKGCRIESQEKNEMVQKGQWCPKGCTVDVDGNLIGTPDRSRRWTGFGEMCSLYSPIVSIPRMSRKFLTSHEKEEEFQSFINNWCGLRYRPRTKTPRALDLWRRLRGGHRRGTVPPGAIFLTAGGDVHDETAYWIVRAWGEGCTSWLVDWGIVHIGRDENGRPRPGSQLSPLEGMVLNRDWPLVSANPLGELDLLVLKLGIDCGWLPVLVHEFARKFPGERVLTVAGDTQPTVGQPWSFSIVERNQRTGKPYPGGLKRWAVNTDMFKIDLHDRWAAPLEEAGAWLATEADWEQSKPYFQQLTAEGWTMKPNKKGFPVRVWHRYRDNHWLDCETYARAMAEMITGGIWTNLAQRFQAATRRQRQLAKSIDEGDQERAGFVRRPSGGFGKRRG